MPLKLNSAFFKSWTLRPNYKADQIQKIPKKRSIENLEKWTKMIGVYAASVIIFDVNFIIFDVYFTLAEWF